MLNFQKRKNQKTSDPFCKEFYSISEYGRDGHLLRKVVETKYGSSWGWV